MTDVNNQDTMQRHEQIIELSTHIKNKLKQHQHPPASASFINSSDEFIEVDSVDDETDLVLDTSDHVNRTRGETFTTYQVSQPSASFFTAGKPKQLTAVSVQHQQPASVAIHHPQPDKLTKHQQCHECIHRDRIIQYDRQRLLRLYDENKQLHEQLRSSVLLNRQYENDIQKMKHHLKKVNAHLYEYHLSYDQLKQTIASEKKRDEEKEEQDKQQSTVEHLKRLRYEVDMYNRLVAAKQQQQQQEHK